MDLPIPSGARIRTALMQTVAKAAKLAAGRPAFDVTTTAQLRDLALTMAKLCGWDGKPSVTTYYGDDNRTVVVCDPERRQQLIEQRQRLLEQEATLASSREVEAAAPAALPAKQTQSDANVGAMNGIVTHDQSPVAQPDPVFQRWESIGKAESWKTNEPEHHAGSFGPWPEEYE
jgi:hypothetical protein